MSGQIVAQMEKLNGQFETFIDLQQKAKREAVQAAEEQKKAANRQTAAMKVLGITIDETTGKMKRNGMLVNEFGQEVNRVGEVVSNFNKRTTVLTKSIEALNKQGKSFEIFSRETREAYMAAGGNIFEFVAEGILGSREEITLFGQEAAKLRKIAYGFLPPGTFRLLNKVASGFQLIGSATRRASRTTQEYEDDIKKLKAQQEKLNKDTQEEEYNNLQQTIDKMRKDMRESGGNIIGTTIKALGKIPRAGKFTKAFGEAREQTNLQAQANIITKLGFSGFGMSLDDVAARRTELQSKMASRYGSGQRFRTAEEDLELDTLNEILKPLGVRGYFSDAIITGFKKSPIVAIMNGIESFMKKSGLFLRKVFSKDFGKKVMAFAGTAIKFMFSMMIYATLFFTLLYFFRKPIMRAFGAIGELVKNTLPAFKKTMMNSFNLIKDSFMDIYNGFKDGDLMRVFEGIWGVAWGLLGAAFKTLMAVGAVALVGLGAFIGNFGERIIAWGTNLWNGDWQQKLKSIAKVIAILAILFIGWPAIIGAAIAGGIVSLINFFRKRFFADGGTTPAGMSIVGERGPEILNLPAGSKITSNAKSRKMAGGTVNNFNITINAKDSSKAEMRRMADEIGRMINSKINRSTSSSTFR